MVSDRRQHVELRRPPGGEDGRDHARPARQDDEHGQPERRDTGALKYADLSTDRVKDYVFDWDRMLAFEGNTAPYLQYAHARIRSILRRAAESRSTWRTTSLASRRSVAQERDLILQLLHFDTAVQDTLERYSPHRMCTYLFDLAQSFTSFYEACPVLKADPQTRAFRIRLCEQTARVLAKGLGLLGIEAPERM